MINFKINSKIKHGFPNVVDIANEFVNTSLIWGVMPSEFVCGCGGLITWTAGSKQLYTGSLISIGSHSISDTSPNWMVICHDQS